jgi:hypothetical protein
MSLGDIIMAVLIPAGSALVIFIGICIRKRFVKFVDRVSSALRAVESMERRGQLRIAENRLLFKGILVVIEVLEGKEINGNVAQLKTEYDQYLRDQAIH